MLIPTSQFVRSLVAARLAADVSGVPTVLIARTDAHSANLLTADVDERDRPFIHGERTPEGFHQFKGGIKVRRHLLALLLSSTFGWSCKLNRSHWEDQLCFLKKISWHGWVLVIVGALGAGRGVGEILELQQNTSCSLPGPQLKMQIFSCVHHPCACRSCWVCYLSVQ